MARKVFSKKDWDRTECKFIRGITLILMFPLIVIAWISRWIDEYVSDFLYWVDDLVETICWYYIQWRKR